MVRVLSMPVQSYRIKGESMNYLFEKCVAWTQSLITLTKNSISRLVLLVLISLLSVTYVQAKTTYYHVNTQGTPVGATDESSWTQWGHSYTAFGYSQGAPYFQTHEAGSSSSHVGFGFGGHVEDVFDGRSLVYMQARYYDPELGRFLSIDPVGFVESNPQSFNQYTYGNNNPNKYVDPNGEIPFLIPVAMFLAKEGAAEVASRLTGGLTDVLSTSRMLRNGWKWGARKLRSESTVAGSIRNVNPTGGTGNCVNCAIATDAMLAGRKATALPGDPVSIGVLEKVFGGTFRRVNGELAIEAMMSDAGDGARGIVFGARRGQEIGHVWNVVNQKGTVRFLDGQKGVPASFEGYTSIRFLRTD